jgi:hypothetical protein
VTVRSLLLVGDPGETQVGAHLFEAAVDLGVSAEVCDTRQAYAVDPVTRRVLWWLGGRRPARLDAFGEQVWARVREVRPDVVLATGLAPLNRDVLDRIGRAGIVRANFLTDDPWNPVHRAPWFLRALPAYDWVFSPRDRVVPDLRRAGVRHVERVWFAFNPRIHFPAGTVGGPEDHAGSVDVLVAGGADRERVAMVSPLIRAGLSVGLYGGYWSRFPETRAHARGMLDAAALRQATMDARVVLGMVRRGNRDDHSMRSFEVPAMKGCLLAERTNDHAGLFGPDGQAVSFFDGADDLVAVARRLLAQPAERQRLAEAAHRLIVSGRHTYRDRLEQMLQAVAS